MSSTRSSSSYRPNHHHHDGDNTHITVTSRRTTTPPQQQPPTTHRRRRQVVVAVDDFAHRKGVTKALQGFRERQERKRLETAKALRSYRKVMKRAGYELNNSRGRHMPHDNDQQDGINKNDSDVMEEKDEKQQNSATNSQGNNSNGTTDHTPATHLHSPKRKNAKAQPAVNDWRASAEQERRQRLRERRQRTRRLQQRSSKGQPIMKNLVRDILHKLEKEQQQQEEE